MFASLSAPSPYPGFSFLHTASYSLTANAVEVRLRCRRACPVLPEEGVILQYLDFLGGEVEQQTLGLALGFALTDDFTATPLRYRDPAEVALWKSLLQDLETYGLVTLTDGFVRHTEFAVVAVQQQIKYDYFEAESTYWQFSDLRVPDDFPFASIGLTTRLDKAFSQEHPASQPAPAAPPRPTSPAAPSVNGAAVLAIVTRQLKESGLNEDVEVLGLAADERPATYPQSRNVSVTGYCYRLAGTPATQDAADYRITGAVADKASPALTAALNEPTNTSTRLRWGHLAEFSVFWANPEAIIDAVALSRFATDWQWTLLLPDTRLAWSDPAVLPALLRLLPARERYQLSELIPLPLLEATLDSYPGLWDWRVLSMRFSDQFITAKLTAASPEGDPLYPWDFEVLSGRSPKVIEGWLAQLLRSPWADLMGCSESFQWDWATLAKNLSETFLLAHLDALPFSRAIMLARGAGFLEAALRVEIVAGQVGGWHWNHVADTLSQQFLWDQLPALAKFLPWPQVLERLLGPGVPVPAGFALARLRSLIQAHRDDINPLTGLDIVWTPGLIEFFDSLGLLHWASTSQTAGFECHPAVAWTDDYFIRYHHQVDSDRGATHVSAQIGSLDLVNQFPGFAWDWTALSGNPRLTWTRQLTARYRDRIVWSRLLGRFGASEVANRLPDLHAQLLEARPDALPDLWNYANSKLPVPTLLGWLSTYSPYLQLAGLTRRDPEAVAELLLDNSTFDLSWDWSALATSLPPGLLTDLLRAAEVYCHHNPVAHLADLSLPAAARLPLDFSLTVAPGLLLPWNWGYVSQQLTPEQLDAHLTALAPKIDWGIIAQKPSMEALLTGKWAFDPSIHSWLPWPQVSRLLTPAQVEAHLDMLVPHLDWNHLTRQPAFAPLVLTQLLDHEAARERLPWGYILEKLVAPGDLASNLIGWSRRLQVLIDPEVSADARTAFTRRLPVAAIIADHYDTTSDYPALSIRELAALPLDWTVLSGDTRLMHRLTVDTLRHYRNLWHWPTLSRNQEINANIAYLLNEHLRQRWDWEYISQYSSFIRPLKKVSEAKKHFKKFARFIDWPAMSLRHDLTFFGELLETYADRPWNWAALSASPALRLTDNALLSLRDKPWDWAALSTNDQLKVSFSTVAELVDKPWDWAALAASRSVTFDHAALVALADKSWDWAALVRRADLKWNARILRDFASYPLDWSHLSTLRSFDWSASFIREFQQYLDWRVLSRTPPLDLTEPVLREFASHWDFGLLSRCAALKDPPPSTDPTFRPAQPARLLVPTADLPWDWLYLSGRLSIHYDTHLLDGLARHLNWHTLSRRAWGRHFEEGWVQRYRQHWDFPVLAVYAELPRAAQEEIMACIKADETRILPYLYNLERHALRVPQWAGYAFHNTHLTNAASIIRSGQLLSRREVLKTKHKLADASGSINHFPSEVWNYARLYYRPHTLTQFYVERLGFDSSMSDSKNFFAAENLGFPKCPIPVCFRFRLAEILATQPERFHISNGNMQSNSTRHGTLRQIYSLFDCGNLLFHHLDKDGFLGDRFEEFRSISQQEILLRNSLDMTNLATIDIIVPDAWAYGELLNLIGADHPLAQRIQIGYSNFHDGNKAVDCSYSDTHVDVDTDFADAHDLLLECAELSQADLSEMEPGTYRLAGNRLLTQHRLRVSWPAPVSFRVSFRDKVTSRPGGAREYELFQSAAPSTVEL